VLVEPEPFEVDDATEAKAVVEGLLELESTKYQFESSCEHKMR
jgi:hypothetical protein